MSGTLQGLSVNDIVDVTISLQPIAAGTRNFGVPLVLGSSNVITTAERFRQYTSLAGVGGDFLTTSPEYLAATLFFEQNPTPNLLFIGEWAQTATPGKLLGGYLGNTAAINTLITTLAAITNGSLKITTSGTLHDNESTISLVGVTNLNAVASILTSVIGAGTVIYNANYSRFELTTTATGTSANFVVAAATAGTDLSGLLGLTTATGAVVTAGIVAETLETAVNTVMSLSSAWYALAIAVATAPASSDVLAVANIIQSSNPSRIFLWTSQDATTLNATDTTSLPYLFNSEELWRTFPMYSSASPYAALGAFGIAATVNYSGSNTVITLMMKQVIGLTPENLNETQAATLKAKNCNVYATYQNGSNVLQWGTMAYGYFFDVIQGADWLANQVQANRFTILQTKTKIPLTDPGMQQLKAGDVQALEQGVTNGLIGANLVWSGPSFGAIVTGQTLSSGYYVYIPSVTTLTVAQRQSRTAPLAQIAATFAGAVHQCSVQINIVE